MFKVAAAYLVAAWVLVQIADVLAPQLNLPEWAPRLVTFILLLDFPLALVLAWVFDVTAAGIKTEFGSKQEALCYRWSDLHRRDWLVCIGSTRAASDQ